ncbi:glycerophosphodiester phosphodiesterase [Aquabacterium sp.]|uniref:glycerophosphodiester phosphodiesterase n=1 Tax=Aquabacterium sp. TaxID=1872578 RepID=UPI0019969E28|nr:glycerophosphodiester phosphodiesterase [Aquabacterium sp.]MBC7701086.1 glycerophosphodiester phosphodiesterase [Aquabacterium sp.]
MNQPDKALLTPWPYPRWIAHRGAGKLAPENTLAAFRLGAAHGFRMFECDVKLSADGEPFLLHDSDLSRTTSGQGVAGEKRWDELSWLDAGSWHSPPYAGEPLLRLETLARWLQANELMVNLEIKPSPGHDALTGEVVAREVRRLWAGQAVWPLLSSFSVEALKSARDAAPEVPRALLLERLQPGWLDAALSLACVAVVGHHPELNAERIGQAHAAGLNVLTYTVNDSERAQALWALGLDGLITDAVDHLAPDRP